MGTAVDSFKRDGNQSPRTSADDRLLDAATHIAACHGYSQLTVERVLGMAGVSRATFYQYFSNVDDCFWSAYSRHAEQLVSDVSAAARRGRDAELAVLEALVAIALSRPHIARLLMHEGLAAGPRGPVERDALISKLEQAMTRAAPLRSVIDLPAGILIGATFRFLSMRLSEDAGVAGLCDDVRAWALTFTHPPSRTSWSSRLFREVPRPRSAEAIQSSRARPRGSPSGRPRERILRATAATIREKGYQAVTVADIVGAAGVSRRTFYNEFSSKADAFIATYEQGFQQTLAACTPAFFTPRAWPERVWHSARAFTQLMVREPLIAYLGFVECYALGPSFARRVHDTQLAFTLFLEDGYRQRAEAHSLSHAYSALTAAAIFEAGFQASLCGPSHNIWRFQPLAVYVALAPFIGVDEAGEFVEGKLSGGLPRARM